MKKTKLWAVAICALVVIAIACGYAFASLSSLGDGASGGKMAVIISGIVSIIAVCLLAAMSSGSQGEAVVAPVPGKKSASAGGNMDAAKSLLPFIEEIEGVLNGIADGNLDFTLKLSYEGDLARIEKAMHKISDSLNDTIGKINESADKVANEAGQLSSGAQTLSQGSAEQAASVEELAATITQIQDQIKDAASGALEAKDKANDSGRDILECNQQMGEMIKAMAEISDKSNEIGKIIKTIEDIAFQTNILALNAAVEAARAGAAGKGFAVVADEVRNLANKSQEASKNTSDLIEGTIRAVEKGTRIANDTADSLKGVVDASQETADTVQNIAEAANEQVSSIVQVTEGINQIASVVQANSSTAAESAVASETLLGQAEVLRELVDKFRLKAGMELSQTDITQPREEREFVSFTPQYEAKPSLERVEAAMTPAPEAPVPAEPAESKFKFTAPAPAPAPEPAPASADPIATVGNFDLSAAESALRTAPGDKAMSSPSPSAKPSFSSFGGGAASAAPTGGEMQFDDPVNDKY